MKTFPTKKQPWNIKVRQLKQGPDRYNVDVRMSFADEKLRKKISELDTVYFAYEFNRYWFKNGIKSARVYKTSTPTKQTIIFSTRMECSFDSSDKSALFAEGIERAIDLFIMELVLEERK